jgi:hypothetical protein
MEPAVESARMKMRAAPMLGIEMVIAVIMMVIRAPNDYIIPDAVRAITPNVRSVVSHTYLPVAPD